MTPMWTQMATAIMFLTRIPVARSGSGDPADLAASTQYFPLVGVLIGTLVSIVFVVSHLIWTTDIAVLMCLISAILLTGGFHEDGVADVADSAGAWTVEKKLEVMRDSRVGTYGALALIITVLLKFISLSSIAGLIDADQVDSSAATGSFSVLVATIIFAHVLGRWSTLPLIRFTPYAREESGNKVFAEGVTNARLAVGSATLLVVMFACWPLLGSGVLLIVAITCVAIMTCRQWFMRSIGGITGDCLGAANQLSEVLVYLCVSAMLVR